MGTNTLHLYKQSNLNQLPWKQPAKPAYEKTFLSRSNNFSSNSSHRSHVLCGTITTMNTKTLPLYKNSNINSITKITHTAKGEVTIHGLMRGYIQASPFYPTTALQLCMIDYEIIVKGTKENGWKVHNRFDKISDARKYLYSTH